MRCGIVIPYRDRAEHLSVSAPILKNAGHVYVVEQMGDKLFNRGKLCNAAFIEFKKEFDYFIFNDVDMVPESAEYSYCENPCQLATMVEQFNWSVPYPSYFGGVTLLPNDKFEQVNGFGNVFDGYGAEDDHLRKKFEEKRIQIESRQCRFKSLPHQRVYDHEGRMKNFRLLNAPIDWNDGLTSCIYEVVDCEDMGDYTLLKVKF